MNVFSYVTGFVILSLIVGAGYLFTAKEPSSEDSGLSSPKESMTESEKIILPLPSSTNTPPATEEVELHGATTSSQ